MASLSPWWRAHPSDDVPEEAKFELVQVPSRDGTFMGGVMGGGVDVMITLPGVTKAGWCKLSPMLKSPGRSAVN